MSKPLTALASDIVDYLSDPIKSERKLVLQDLIMRGTLTFTFNDDIRYDLRRYLETNERGLEQTFIEPFAARFNVKVRKPAKPMRIVLDLDLEGTPARFGSSKSADCGMANDLVETLKGMKVGGKTIQSARWRSYNVDPDLLSANPPKV